MTLTWRMTLGVGLLALLLGGLGGFLLSQAGTNRQILALQIHSDSVNAAAHLRDSTTSRVADSLKARIAALQRAKRPVTQDSTGAAVAALAVRDAKTGKDSAAALVVQVAKLTSEVATLKANAAKDAQSLADALLRGDTLETALHKQTDAVADLHDKINALNHHTLPHWLRLSFDVLQKGCALKGAVDVIRGH